MEQNLALEQYLSDGIQALIQDAFRATFRNPKESAFWAKYALASKHAQSRRHKAEKEGEHIPSFLIASITGSCNLRCAGCYDRANQPCHQPQEMSRKEWKRVFKDAEKLGVSVILLAGGEPLMRPDVIEEASNHPSLLFPIFTNGTLLEEEMLQKLDKHRQLIPIVSLEGDAAQTDARRGKGVYQKTLETMKRLQNLALLFGASITVTSQNLETVTSEAFLSSLREKGAKAVVFVEYVPVENPELALSDAQRDCLAERVNALRQKNEMILISFPGDEKASGGCLAAGRGFFHINAAGGAEPCPFSPYSDTSLKNTSLREALHSPLFTRLREEGLLEKEHQGGCTLFAQAESVQALATKTNAD